MPNIPTFKAEKQISLTHDGECYLLGLSLAGLIYAEEFYDESYIAHHKLNLEGDILESLDENFGETDIVPLYVPSDGILSNHPTHHPLNHTGLRVIGLREEEKVMEWVKPLAIMEKMPLLKVLNLKLSPMMIFGIAESRVLSQIFIDDKTQMVCRRIQLLRALPEIQYTEDGLAYDYDTIVFSVLHAYNIETEDYPPLHIALQNYPELHNAQDCLYYDDRLIVSTHSHLGNPSEIHIFKQDEITV